MLLKLVISFLFAILSAGCAHNVLYSEARDKQGQDAKRAVEDAKVAGAIDTLETTFADVATREVTRSQERAANLFNLELRTVANAPSLAATFASGAEADGLQTITISRLMRMGFKDVSNKSLDAFRTSGVRKNALQGAFERTQVEFLGAVGHRFENCTMVYASSDQPLKKGMTPSKNLLGSILPERRVLASSKFAALVDNCAKIDAADDAILKPFLEAGGDVKSLIEKMHGVEKSILAYEDQKEAARKALDAAIEDFRKSGADSAGATGGSKLATLEERASALRDAVRAIGALGSAFGAAGSHVIAAERLKRLEVVLGAIAGGDSGDKIKLTVDEQVAVALVRDLPTLADEADKLLSEARKPRRVPYLAAIQQQRLVLQSFEAAQKARQRQLEALRNQKNALLSEAFSLASVLSRLSQDASWGKRSIANLDTTLSPSEKLRFYRALATYADDVRRFRIDNAAWDARAQAAEYEVGLVQSKYIAARWDALLDMMATVLADYHAAGIKTADLMEFFKALGLVAIGIGVAK